MLPTILTFTRGWGRNILFLPHPRVKVSIVGSLRDREVACSASDRQGTNFESCVWRTVSSQSSHHPQEVLLAQLSLYVHKGGLMPNSFHFHFIFVSPRHARRLQTLWVLFVIWLAVSPRHARRLPAMWVLFAWHGDWSLLHLTEKSSTQTSFPTLFPCVTPAS